MKNFPLQTFFLVYAPLQTFFFRNSYYFCYTYRFCKQFILSFQALQTIFFNIFHPPPPPKNNGPSLNGCSVKYNHFELKNIVFDVKKFPMGA